MSIFKRKKKYLFAVVANNHEHAYTDVRQKTEEYFKKLKEEEKNLKGAT